MLKKFLNGLVFGTGFGIAFVTICILGFYFISPQIFVGKYESESLRDTLKEISTVPSVHTSAKYLGSLGIYTGKFNNEGVLSKGPGEIVGMALVNGEPVEGLKLRLALNGTVMSQLATTDASGQYNISVPYGKYVINGFEFDHATVDNVLPNKISHPQIPHSSSVFEVSVDSIGHGLNFKFIDPIIKSFEKRKYLATEEIILDWEPYPGASEYLVQIYEKPDAHSWSNDTIFKWQDRPKLSEPRIKLSDYDVKLKPGFFYLVKIDARNERRAMVSETTNRNAGYDFEIVE